MISIFKNEVPEAFTVLDDNQLATVVAAFASCKTYPDGEVLFRAGATAYKLTSSGAARLRFMTVRRAIRAGF